MQFPINHDPPPTTGRRFKLGPKTQNYSLGGMGCSAGVIALDLAKQLLEHNPGEYCLVVSHENITNAHYKGRDRSMLVSNCIFRANGAAMLLSSRRADAGGAKYRLQHVVRTNLAADDQAYNCVMQLDDAEEKVCAYVFWGVDLLGWWCWELRTDRLRAGARHAVEQQARGCGGRKAQAAACFEDEFGGG